jgi:hypothetical protein
MCIQVTKNNHLYANMPTISNPNKRARILTKLIAMLPIMQNPNIN